MRRDESVNDCTRKSTQIRGAADLNRRAPIQEKRERPRPLRMLHESCVVRSHCSRLDEWQAECHSEADL